MPASIDRPARIAIRRTVGNRLPRAGEAALHSAAMDLHVIGPLASPAERAAVDAVLGPPESGWVGGPRRPGTDGHSALLWCDGCSAILCVPCWQEHNNDAPDHTV